MEYFSMTTSEIELAFQKATKRWTGCHWPTQFGPRKLDLNGLNSHQAEMLADATSGKESKGWEAASSWLQAVESDARHAKEFAELAVNAVKQEQWKLASELIGKSVELEAKYPPLDIWSPLQKLIQVASKHLNGQRGDDSAI